ncbi:UDP-3-O-(3-hydroxymyristoyl)glucosamine N-acyltransferase [Desulfopila aestuarii]|uniref:UDP-3-O-acylglucosamine N-acyltransferase n=1 Tax=Desulfopila aestuarii DSM 18488 TaxID=1121416 RepID=A0A1M7Y3T8_9BACT|nr:UDP-3-O-(3-hydroxymyristoyl)glucosamine N-acyltransferase [Desulfopila aestuarii]SHO46888.1 UDP-3-O-[3-hydroxymyristoyl] glucosamine N-acyltransferase [Desulfopila aestuarii DSM 18488]
MGITTMELGEIAKLVGGELCGDPAVRISSLTSIEAATADDLTFLVKAKEIERLEKSFAGAALVPMNTKSDLPMPVIKVRDPYLASAIIHNTLLAKPFQARGVDPRACVGRDCVISDEVTIAPLAVIGDRVRIGKRVTIGAGTVVGDDVVIGDDVELKANVTLYDKCVLGNKVIIHSGTVIGSDGYGYATDGMGQHVKRPHVGRVRIDDDVEIGANVCIDRGAFGDTWIQSGVKIDNQVQVAHNVVIGPNSLLVAQVGISGSTTLGRNVVLGGQVGVAGHIHLEDQVMVAAGSGIHASLPKGAKVGGIPAFDVRAWARSAAVYAKLPEMRSEMRKLQKKVAELEALLAEPYTTGETHE